MNHLSVELDDRHNNALEEMAKELGMSKVAVLRQALRLYQTVHVRQKKGEQMAFVNKDGQVIPALILSLLNHEAQNQSVAP